MQVRLAFSVAIQVDADILLVDEILAVGDAAFQQKCFDVFNRMREERKTLVLVTHSMGELNRFCDRALLIERGSPVLLAEPSAVADRYLELNFGRDPTPDKPLVPLGFTGHEDDTENRERRVQGATRPSVVRDSADSRASSSRRISAMIADVATTHPTSQAKRKGSPRTIGCTRLAKGSPPSMPTVGIRASQWYGRH